MVSPYRKTIITITSIKTFREVAFSRNYAQHAYYPIVSTSHGIMVTSHIVLVTLSMTQKKADHLIVL